MAAKPSLERRPSRKPSQPSRKPKRTSSAQSGTLESHGGYIPPLDPFRERPRPQLGALGAKPPPKPRPPKPVLSLGSKHLLSTSFPWVTSWALEHDDGGDVLVAEVESEAVTFERLAALSEQLATRAIDIVGRTGNHGYCDTCDDPFGYVALRIRGAQIQNLAELSDNSSS